MASEGDQGFIFDQVEYLSTEFEKLKTLVDLQKETYDNNYKQVESLVQSVD